MKDEHIFSHEPIEFLRELFERVKQLEEYKKAVRRRQAGGTKSTGGVIQFRVVAEEICGVDEIRKNDPVKD